MPSGSQGHRFRNVRPVVGIRSKATVWSVPSMDNRCGIKLCKSFRLVVIVMMGPVMINCSSQTKPPVSSAD